MSITDEPLHPDNKTEFADGDRVEFLIPGLEGGTALHGRILGKASHIGERQ
jgi:hypothetical protein